MKVELTSALKTAYPEAVFGSLIVRNVANIKADEALGERKRGLEKKIREAYADVAEDNTIQSYNAYFKKWGKTYPIEFQITTIKNGGRFPNVSVLVDCMFLAELKNRLLTSGHNLDAIQNSLVFDVTKGGERYLKINGKEQELKGNDVILRDEKGILASVLYGPAQRTGITPETKNALYFAWCPHDVGKESIRMHLNDILLNVQLVFGSVESEIQIHR